MGAGRGRTPSTTRDTEANRDSSSDKEMTSGPGLETPPSPQWGMSAYTVREVRPHRHPDGADGAMPERASEYGIMEPADPTGDPAAAEIQ